MIDIVCEHAAEMNDGAGVELVSGKRLADWKFADDEAAESRRLLDRV